VRGNPSVQRNVGTRAEAAAAGGKTKAGAVFNEGDIRVKLATVRLLAKPSQAASVVTTLTKAGEMIFLGKESGRMIFLGKEARYVQVETGKGAGWVKKLLIAR
jgi:hypothetical protein